MRLEGLIIRQWENWNFEWQSNLFWGPYSLTFGFGVVFTKKFYTVSLVYSMEVASAIGFDVGTGVWEEDTGGIIALVLSVAAADAVAMSCWRWCCCCWWYCCWWWWHCWWLGKLMTASIYAIPWKHILGGIESITTIFRYLNEFYKISKHYSIPIPTQLQDLQFQNCKPEKKCYIAILHYTFIISIRLFDPNSTMYHHNTISKNFTVGSCVKIKSRIAGLLYPAGWEYNTPAPEFEKSVH